MVIQDKKLLSRATFFEHVLREMNAGRLEAVICRAPEFYGPDKTQSLTNSFVINNVKDGKPAIVPLRDDVVRSLIYTPDASKGMALIANSAGTYNQTWHLPVAKPITYAEYIEIIEKVVGHKVDYRIMTYEQFEEQAKINKMAAETMEMLPRYAKDNIFSSEKFNQRFPEFKTTTFEEGLTRIFN